jgi:hypothetical protein
VKASSVRDLWRRGRAVAGYAFVVAALVFGVTRDGQRRTEATIKANIQACERGKRDRFDDARVFEAMASYYDGVTQAASVKQDVKRIAARVRDTLLVGEAGKESRIILCDQAVRHRRVVPDQRLLDKLHTGN